jgi:multidrug efflux pump
MDFRRRITLLSLRDHAHRSTGDGWCIALLYLKGLSLNIYSQIGLTLLVGLAAKNGMLIVEFANQLRGDSRAFPDAPTEATRVLFRPILMRGIMRPAGSVLLLSSGVGSEARVVIDTVVMSGVIATTFLICCGCSGSPQSLWKCRSKS